MENSRFDATVRSQLTVLPQLERIEEQYGHRNSDLIPTDK